MKVFISHSSYDKWVARQISFQLNQKGHTTFLDEKDIKTGDSIDSSIQKHLKNSDQLLILLSPASLKSHWVFIELGGAQALGKTVVPILFHVGVNEIPQPMSSMLCRDINEFEKYINEIGNIRQPKRDFDKSPSLRKSSPMIKIGDWVTVIDGSLLTTEDKGKDPTWVDNMDKLSGRKARIISSYGEFYILNIEESFKWRREWLIKS